MAADIADTTGGTAQRLATAGLPTEGHGHAGNLLILALAFTLGLLSAALAQDEPYPTHPVRLIVTAAPGGNPDVLGRLLADRMTRDLGRAFIVENITGAAGAIAAITAAKAPPDGYTLLSGDSALMAIMPSLNPDIGYDPTKDFTPITALAAVPTILVANPKLPASTLAEFIALAKKEPGKIAYGSAGIGTIHHLTMAIFADLAAIDVLHVPYRNGTAMVNGVLTGEIQVGWSGIPNVMQQIASGQLRGYCISVRERSASMPTMPTCRGTRHQGFRCRHGDGAVRAGGNFAENRRPSADRNRQGHA